MKISETWLRSHVDPPLDTAGLAAVLTEAGLEVDATEPLEMAFSGVVVARVTAVAPHPEADRLRLCEVDVGEARLQVVCGAPNVIVGMLAPFAPIGSSLPERATPLTAAQVRGVRSEGMLLSRAELGLGEDHDGLWSLPPGLPVGSDLKQALMPNDVIIELDLTPNRADCLSIFGVAREVAALTAAPLQPVPVAAPQATTEVPAPPAAVQVPEACPVYLAQRLSGLDPAARTPLWMQERLRRSGIRPRYPAVDVTNYVLLELGQPLHAFDAEHLAGTLTVRFAAADESLTLLDGRCQALEPDCLVIADQAGPVALAGIMGGQRTAVSASTTEVVLESALFQPSAVAGRARRFGLHTDASHRFERGVDPAGQAAALARAARLLLDIAGGSVSTLTEVRSAEPVVAPIVLRPARVRRVLGLPIEAAQIEVILTRLQMQVVRDSAERWQVRPPSYRRDVQREEDLIEEIARVHGYRRLQPVPVREAQRMLPAAEGRHGDHLLRRALAARGYQEAITYSFVDPALQRLQLGADAVATAVDLANPLSRELAQMRVSLWPGLLATIAHNRNRQQARVRLFELGRVFHRRDNDIDQPEKLAMAAIGARLPEQWGVSDDPVDFFDLKGDFEQALPPSLRAELRYQRATRTGLHPGRSAQIRLHGEPIGWIGELHPATVRQLDLDQPPLLLEVDLSPLRRQAVPSARPPSPFPAVRRDLAVVLPLEVPAASVIELIREQGGEQLDTVVLFDDYRGEGVTPGSRSLGFGLIFQDKSHTLTEQDVTASLGRIVLAIRETAGGEIRREHDGADEG